jgi:hypothetical protein
VIAGGWINHNYIQLGYQLADSMTGFAYSFVGSCIILLVMNFIPGLSLRASEEDEIMGIDDAEIGEFAVSYSRHLVSEYFTDRVCSMITSRSLAMSFPLTIVIPWTESRNTP